LADRCLQISGRYRLEQCARRCVRFAWIKATEGGDRVDEKFAQNWASAKAAGCRAAPIISPLVQAHAGTSGLVFQERPNDPDRLAAGARCRVEWPIKNLPKTHPARCCHSADENHARRDGTGLWKKTGDLTRRSISIVTSWRGNFRFNPIWVRQREMPSVAQIWQSPLAFLQHTAEWPCCRYSRLWSIAMLQRSIQ